jgi:protein SCO1/2
MNRRALLTNHAATPLASLFPATGEDKNRTALTGPRANYFPNALLRTHEGKEVRFYDDLIHGNKIVMFNFMYVKCEGICMGMTHNLLKVQRLLGDRIGRDIFMYSITLQPEQDTPAELKKYAEMHSIRRGWTFLTGKPDDIEVLRRKLGFRDPNPAFDADKKQHIGLVRFGNEAIDRWAACPALANPSEIAKAVLWMESPKSN